MEKIDGGDKGHIGYHPDQKSMIAHFQGACKYCTKRCLSGVEGRGIRAVTASHNRNQIILTYIDIFPKVELKMLSDNFKAEFKTKLSGFKQKVKMLYFTSKTECNSCAEGLRFIEELAEISDKLIMVVHDMDDKPELAESCGIDKVPAYVLLAESGRDYGIRFFGVPSGEAVESFAYALSLIAKSVEIPADATLENIMDVNRPVHIEVFTTPQCPLCAKVMQTAHLIAYVNDNMRADMIDTTPFPTLAKKYTVQSVPTIVLNGTVKLIGKQTTETFLEAINRL